MPNTSSARLCARLALAATLGVAPAIVRADPAPAGAQSGAGDATLTAERAHLRGQLDRVNAEIDALKRSARGVGDDYRLRARLADAEALARRLIDIEARLGLRAPAALPGPLPVASPTDSPSDLQAKADILDDRARRVRLEADALDHRVVALKGRQDLRRRAADLDRDPFAPLEGSKRRVMTIPGPDNAGHLAAPSALPTGTGSQPPVDHPGASLTTGNTPGSTSTTQPPAAPAGSMPPTPLTGPPPTALSLELRDLLDPATVADIRRLEGARSQSVSLQALERAVAALRARATALDGQARAMRQTARTPR